MDNTKNDLFYRPKLEIERNYYSEGEFQKRNPLLKEEKPPLKKDDPLSRTDNVINNLLKIRDVLPFLPEKLHKILRDIIEKLLFQTIIEEEKIKETQKLEEQEKIDNKYVDEYEPTPESDTGSKITMNNDKPLREDVSSFLDELGPSGFTIKVVRAHPNGRLAEKQYRKDSLSIKEDFVSQMNFALQKYLFPLINVMSESGVTKIEYLNYDYDATSVNGITPQLQHLNDTIVRNSILMNEKIRLMNFTHDANATVSVMTAFDVVAKERIRYYDESYDMGIERFSDMYKNQYLTESRIKYDIKYSKARSNMYKYLNSTVIITTEILKEALSAGISKCHLLSQGINIFEHKEYESQGYTNPAGSNSAEFAGNQVDQTTGERKDDSLLDKVKKEVEI